MVTQATATNRPSCLSLSCRGVGSSPAVSIIPAIFPISVSMPVAVTTPSPRPVITMQPMYSLSPGCFAAGRLSPVSMASLHDTCTPVCSVQSAATLSPASNSSTSPGTTVRAPTSSSLPLRRTRAVGAESSFSASSVFSVRYSCRKPMVAFISTMIIMVMASVPSPISTEMSVAAARIRIIRSLNCEKNMAATLAPFFPRRRFSPTFARRAFASASDKPTDVFCSMRFSPFLIWAKRPMIAKTYEKMRRAMPREIFSENFSRFCRQIDRCLVL